MTGQILSAGFGLRRFASVVADAHALAPARLDSPAQPRNSNGPLPIKSRFLRVQFGEKENQADRQESLLLQQTF